MSVEFTAENRNAGSTIPVRRCCSFCRQPGHNVSTCNDGALIDFENTCVHMYTTTSELRFVNWLNDYASLHENLVKSYAVRYCGCSVRQYMFSCLNHIIAKIRTLSRNEQPNNQDEQPSQSVRNDSTTSTLEYERRRRLHALSAAAIVALIHGTIGFFGDRLDDDIRESLNRALEQYNSRKFNIQTNVIESVNATECECNICYDSKQLQQFVKLNCGHQFCKDCMKQSLKTVRTEFPQCAFCRTEIKNMELTSQEILDEFNDIIIK